MRCRCGGPDACYMTSMPFARSLFILVCCTAPVGHAACAGFFVAETEPDALQILEPVARKGTRSYMSDSAATAAPADAQQAPAAVSTDALDQCMATWDASTHISKSNWKDICKRQLKESDAMSAQPGH
jgi:hypothetical protein